MDSKVSETHTKVSDSHPKDSKIHLEVSVVTPEVTLEALMDPKVYIDSLSIGIVD